MKFWQSISKKDLVFGVILFALVIVVSLFQPSNKILAEFEENAVNVKSSRYAMNIPYEMVQSIELTEKPDMGQPVDGKDDMILQTGTWHNDTWGNYEMCAEIATDNCIVIHLTDGRIFVISRRDDAETEKVFEEFQGHLEKNTGRS